MGIVGKVISVNTSDKKGVVKTPVAEVLLRAGHGIEGDAHAGDWHRQVSLLGIESFEKMRVMGIELEPGKFAENMTTEGIVLYELPVGTRLQIGETLHEVTQIGKQCHSGCEIKSLVGDCVMPREGIFTKVLKGGKVRPGDSIEIL
ncbi:MAG: MOSC domain-containing protein [Peptoclostridium sp.]|uniref:MOSC domain-containing protein n=1 Tax=Peptoclostridium sp. TaxID=1904860 RepID=UPI00139EF1EC|nr:MOSC domain-containing protein [Peptoclostridium sp.]MZQ75000.1 MOSC domain-containing protein [Peptoclostridium sp.]